MLVLTRKAQESIRIGGSIKVTILRVKGNAVRVGIQAPDNVRIVRSELPDFESPEAPSIHCDSDHDDATMVSDMMVSDMMVSDMMVSDMMVSDMTIVEEEIELPLAESSLTESSLTGVPLTELPVTLGASRLHPSASRLRRYMPQHATPHTTLAERTGFPSESFTSDSPTLPPR